MKVSIVIPIYNSEVFLEKCLDSLVEQSFKDFEALLINDGSTDNSIKICESYAIKDQRFKVYTQSNMGVSVARNKGIEHAMGDWLIFLDSDDSLQKKSLELIFDKIEGNEDFLVARAYLYNEESMVEERYAFKQNFLEKTFTGQELALKYQYKHGSAYGCLFRREFVTTNNITFPIGIKNGEDSIFTTLCHIYAKKVKFVDVHFYNVMERSGSASRSWTIERVLHMEKNFEYFNTFLSTNLELSDEQKIIINYNLFGIATKMFKGIFSNFSLKKYRLVRKAVCRSLPQKIYIGKQQKYKRKVELFNTSIDLYVLLLLLNKIMNK